jgi:hypothetical protein
VIKETAAMDSLTQTASPVAAALALALADVLGLGLPEPSHVTIWPWAADSAYTSAVDLWFTGPERFTEMDAWAARFGVPVISKEPGVRCARAEFTHSGVRFEANASTRPEQA